MQSETASDGNVVSTQTSLLICGPVAMPRLEPVMRAILFLEIGRGLIFREVGA